MVPRACGEHAGDDRELGVDVLCVGSGEDGGDRAVWGPPLARAHLGVALRVPARRGCGGLELSHDCAAPRLLPRTHGGTRRLRDSAPASVPLRKHPFEPASALAGLALPADQSWLFPVTCRQQTSAWRPSGRDAYGLPCKPFGLTLVCCQPVVWDVPDRGVLPFSWDGCSGGVSLRRCRRPTLPSLRDLGPEVDVGSPRPITARLTPVLAGRDRRRGREPQARGLGHDHSLRITAIRRGDGSKRYAVSRPTPTPRA